MSVQKRESSVALAAGGVAGTVTDLVLFPLDTLKTRLQSTQGLKAAGGFRGLYSGLGPVFLGSAPSASVFFVTYEFIKSRGENFSRPPVVHMAAAATGEVIACLVRVPVEVVKQRAQSTAGLSSFSIFKTTLRSEGILGLYRGYWSTVVREIPFSLVQFPIWEFLKVSWSEYEGRSVDSWQSAICGAISGGIAASITTPLDVAKTRIMLSKKGSETAKGYVFSTLMAVWTTEGINGLFAGLVPRVMWISLGGFLFLGSYEKTKNLLLSLPHS